MVTPRYSVYAYQK
jgi:hypothetical protein